MEPRFPIPDKIGGRNYWKLGDLRRYEAALRGEPAPAPKADDENYLRSDQVRVRYGGMSAMSLWRRYRASLRERSPQSCARELY